VEAGGLKQIERDTVTRVKRLFAMQALPAASACVRQRQLGLSIVKNWRRQLTSSDRQFVSSVRKMTKLGPTARCNTMLTTSDKAGLFAGFGDRFNALEIYRR
jgi:hypothetical protein